MTEMIATAEISTSGGVIAPGEEFRCPERVAKRYEQRGVAKRKGADAPGPSLTKSLDRSWEGAAWKTLYEEENVVADNVQCTADEADAWADGDLTLDEITS